MHSERDNCLLPVLHSATRGPITVLVYRGERPLQPPGLYEVFHECQGYYVMAARTDSSGQLEPVPTRELQPQEYPQWEQAMEECHRFICVQRGDPTVPAGPSDGQVAFDSDDERRLREVLEILSKGGDVRSNFLHDATKLLLEAAQVISSARFVYAAGLRELSAADWDAMVMVTHAATFACRLADIVGEEAQDHVDGWLLDTIPVLARIVGDEGAPK